VDEKLQARIGYNESFFRVINEDSEALLPAEAASRIEIVCECGHADCRKKIRVSREAYSEVRSHPARFFVKADHQIEEVESVVEVVKGDDVLGSYYVVEKVEGLPQRVAESTDPRRPHSS
jgi:hypothetical protein